jgi:hypothetical protein
LGMWIGFTGLRIGTGGKLLWTRWWAFGFHKMRGISWLAEHTLSFSRRTLLHGIKQLEKLGIDISLTKIAAAAAYLVTADAEERSSKRRPRRWRRRKVFCTGNEHRDVLFIELIFNDGSLFRNLTRIFFLLQLTGLF